LKSDGFFTIKLGGNGGWIFAYLSKDTTVIHTNGNIMIIPKTERTLKMMILEGSAFVLLVFALFIILPL
jgi:hypothetical protein